MEITLFGGSIDLCESIEFKSRPVSDKTIGQIKEHFSNVVNEYKEYAADEESNFSGEITLYGEEVVTSKGVDEFADFLMNKIQDANGFKVVSEYYGPFSELFLYDDGEEECLKLERIDDEGYVYKVFTFCYDSGEGWCGRCENGEWTELEPLLSDEILDRNDFCWWTWGISLNVDFNVEKYPEVMEKLHELTRKHVKEDLSYEENSWLDDPNFLLCGTAWYPDSLRDVQNYMDEINATIEPIKDECKCSAEGDIYSCRLPFGYATWSWTNDGFKIMGVEL